MLLLLLLLSCFSRVRLCATPQTAAHQALPSLGFSRQEQNGLPFPSPLRGSEKWKWSRSVATRRVGTPWTVAHQAPPSMGFSRQEYWSGLPLPSPWLFSSCGYWKPLCSCSVQASHCDGFSCCRAQVLEHMGFRSYSTWPQLSWLPGSREQAQ